MSRHVHLVMSVELDAEGNPVGARIEEDGATWSYSDRPMTWDADVGADGWTEADEDETAAAHSLLGMSGPAELRAAARAVLARSCSDDARAEALARLARAVDATAWLNPEVPR